ncbi:hypothetical protein R6Z07F_002116 [Ovis aries]
MKPKLPKTCYDLASAPFPSFSLLPHITLPGPVTAGRLQLLHTSSCSRCLPPPCPSLDPSLTLPQVYIVFLNLPTQPPQQQKPLSISTLVPGHLNSSGLSSSLLQFDATLIQSAKNLGYQTDTDPAFRLPKGETDTYTEPET